MARDPARPQFRRTPVSTPAAGANFSVRNDSGGLWLIRSIAFTFVTAAVAVNRSVALAAQAAEDVWWRTVAATVQATTLTRNYSGWNGSPATGDSAAAILLAWPTDGLWLPPGHSLASTVDNIQGADQLSAVVVYMAEYPDVTGEHYVPSAETLLLDNEEYPDGNGILVPAYR